MATTRTRRFAMIFAALLPVAGPAAAQQWPVKPVSFVVPFVPGGATDVLGRIYAERLGAVLGQPVIVDNKPGAGGNVGASFVAKSQPDGHTLFIASSPGFTNAAVLSKNAGFDPLKDFVAVTLLATQAFALALHPSMLPNSVSELVAHAKANPGKLNYATPGIGTPHHLGMELFKSMAGIDVVHVPYRGGAPMTQDVLAGQVQMMLASWVVVGPNLKSGKLKVIAVSSKQPLTQLPDVKSIAVQGYPDFDLTTWFGLIAPAGTPASALSRLADTIGKLQVSDELRQQLTKIGFDPPPTDSPAQFSQRLRADVAKWSKVVQDIGIKPE